MNCPCGRSALGKGLDGLDYCERCRDWKSERIVSHERRQKAIHALVCGVSTERLEEMAKERN